MNTWTRDEMSLHKAVQEDPTGLDRGKNNRRAEDRLWHFFTIVAILIISAPMAFHLFQ